MKFQITGAGWRIGNKLIPVGTVLDFTQAGQVDGAGSWQDPAQCHATRSRGTRSTTEHLSRPQAFAGRRLAVSKLGDGFSPHSKRSTTQE